MKFIIKSNIEIERRGRNRKAIFMVQPTGTKVKIRHYLTANSIQLVLAHIEAKYNTTIYADDFSYNFKLRKDEFVPRPENRPVAILCSIENCKIPAVLYHLEKPMCYDHFMAHEKTMPVVRSIIASRNSFCSCGSGRKYKNCCALNIEHKSGRRFFQPRDI